MIDKVQKIREEVERIQLYTQSEVLKQVLDYIDEVQKEPVSEDFVKTFISMVNATHENNGSYSLYEFAQRLYNIAKDTLRKTVSGDLEEAMRHNAPDNIGIDDLLYWRNGFIAGTKWKAESVSGDLEEYSALVADELPQGTALTSNGEFDIASVRKLIIDACKSGAKWKAEQFEKERLKHCDALTEEQAQIESDFVTQHFKANNRTPTFIDAIEYGMKLQKAQMMKDAVEAKECFKFNDDNMSWHFYPENRFSSYEEYVNYLIEKGFAFEAPSGM